ncbi:MAG: HAMP domain-containing sensor histidine kinase [Myxococcota bacterium]|nr:HAMP domain-containing sensor histidine kinase [Myxococcota bacterium]
MARRRNPDRGRRKRRHRRTSAGTLEIPYDPALDDRSFLDEVEGAEVERETPQQPAASDLEGSREYDLARKVAEKKAGLYIDAGKKAVVVLILLLVPGLYWLGFILGIVWGIRLSRKYFNLMVEPNLRERLVEDEVQKQVHVNVSREKLSLEGEHSRDMEQLSASIAHEIRNPITAAKSLVQQMSEEPDAADNPEYARVAVEELERVERSISHLLRFARDEEIRVSEVRMLDVLESALETFRDRAARDGIEIRKNFDTQGVVQGDADKLRRIIINLVGNGIDAMIEASVEEPQLDVSMGENLAGTEVWVRLKDNGSGIPDELREKIFAPFVTSKSGGTGLGLPITRKLVEGHGGTIELMSEPGQGTEFVLTIPKRTKPGGRR